MQAAGGRRQQARGQWPDVALREEGSARSGSTRRQQQGEQQEEKEQQEKEQQVEDEEKQEEKQQSHFLMARGVDPRLRLLLRGRAAQGAGVPSEVQLRWLPAEAPEAPQGPHFVEHTSARLVRRVRAAEYDIAVHFQVHRFRLAMTGGGATDAGLGQAVRLVATAARRLADEGAPGLCISNEGGWHSTQDAFTWPEGGGSGGGRLSDAERAALGALRRAVVAAVERADAAEDAEIGVVGAAPCAHASPAEAWLNVNRAGGDFNALHDHEGATFSGALWLDAGGAGGSGGTGDAGNAGGGELVFRLTASGDAGRRLGLSAQQLARLTVVQESAPDDGGAGDPALADVCEYASMKCEAGTIILFPGWVPHAVCPFGGGDGGDTTHTRRVSLSFNVFLSEH